MRVRTPEATSIVIATQTLRSSGPRLHAFSAKAHGAADESKDRHDDAPRHWGTKTWLRLGPRNPIQDRATS